MKLYIPFSIIILLFISSCSDDKIPSIERFNHFGGVARHNSVENFGDFRTTLYKVYNFENEDKSGAIQPPLMLNYPFFAFATENGSIVIIENRSVKSSIKLPKGVKVASKMCADSAMNVYAQGSDGKIYSFDYKGNARFELQLKKGPEPEIYSDLLATNNGFLAATNNGYLAFINFEGDIVWQRNSNAAYSEINTGSVEGKLVIPITMSRFGQTDSLLFADEDGKNQKVVPIEKVRILSNVVYMNENLYFSGSEGRGRDRKQVLISMDTTGKINWRKSIPVFTSYVSVDKNENIYFSGSESGIAAKMSGVFKYNKSGEQLWKIYFRASINKPLIIGKKTLAMHAMTEEGSAVFILTKDEGVLLDEMSLTNGPILNTFPVCTDQGVIVFGASQKLALLLITESFFDKIIPY